jgi:hypothetical protein
MIGDSKQREKTGKEGENRNKLVDRRKNRDREEVPSQARCAFLQFTQALATCALFRRNNGDIDAD